MIAILIIAAVAAFVSVPLRRATLAEVAGEDAGTETELADLEARKLAKYREIRDTELDHAQGKLDDAEFERQEAELRADAIAILKELDEARARAGRDAR